VADDKTKAAVADMEKACGEDEACKVLGEQRVNDELTASGRLPVVVWQRIVDHIDHAVKIAGAAHVGLGSDFDGAIMPQGMDDVSHYQQIAAELVRRGYSDQDIQNIMGGNVLRVMTEVEGVSRKMRGEKK
jgi:Membrane dipeptidase (Peptidase family M19)